MTKKNLMKLKNEFKEQVEIPEPNPVLVKLLKETNLMDKCYRLEPIFYMILGTIFILLSAWTIYNIVEYAHKQQEMNIEYNERIIKQQEEQFNRFLEVISREE